VKNAADRLYDAAQLMEVVAEDLSARDDVGSTAAARAMAVSALLAELSEVVRTSDDPTTPTGGRWRCC
jgi:hypothetical protein